MELKASPIRKGDRSIRESDILNFDNDAAAAVHTVGGEEFQQSIDLIKKQQKYFTDPLIGFCEIGSRVLDAEAGTYWTK